MIVLWKNKMWTLANYDYDLFENVKKNEPYLTVELFELNGSSYKKKQQAPVGELKDYSKARNENALSLSGRLN